MLTFIKEYFRKRSQTKAYKKLHTALLDNPQLMHDTREKFEQAFGINQANRTKVQWVRLVNVYGVETVAKMEHMTAEEVMRRTKESFSQRVLRELQNSN